LIPEIKGLIQNCQNESPTHNEYILIKMKKKEIKGFGLDFKMQVSTLNPDG
jgi:hypothetical protein